jgi:hypothetical protein
MKKHNNNLKKEAPSLIVCLMIAAIVTILAAIKITRFSILEIPNMRWWGYVGAYGSIFAITFCIGIAVRYYKRIKSWKLNKYTIFLILSIIMASLETFVTKDNFSSFTEVIINFSLGLGTCFAVFTIFYKLDYEKIKHSFIHLMKNIGLMILFPSMFLIIALMGNIDKTGQFMDLVRPELIDAGVVMGNAAVNAVEQIYLLGSHKYSLIFIVATFIFLIFYALVDFFKEVKDTYNPGGNSRKLKGGNESK